MPGLLHVLVAGLALGAAAAEELYVASDLTPARTFTSPEGPAVDADGYLYAVNLERSGTVGRIAPDGSAEVFVELSGGSIANGIRFDSRGRMFLADYRNHNVLLVDPASRAISVFVHEGAMNQPNDLAIGADDRLYASDPDFGRGAGKLWRIDPDGTHRLLAEDLAIPNGVEVGPDERTLYVNEARTHDIWAYDLSPAGAIGNRRHLARLGGVGDLDGMRCDVEGNLYVTQYGNRTVAVVSPDGQLLREVTLSGLNPSNIAFGGADGRTAYATEVEWGRIVTFRVEHPGREWSLQHPGGTAVVPSSWGRAKLDAGR